MPPYFLSLDFVSVESYYQLHSSQIYRWTNLAWGIIPENKYVSWYLRSIEYKLPVRRFISLSYIILLLILLFLPFGERKESGRHLGKHFYSLDTFFLC